MPVFDRRYYAGPRPTPDGVERYARDAAAAANVAPDREAFVSGEVVAITKAVTDGIVDLIKTDRRVGRLVLSGDVPLGTWKDALLHIASLPREAMHKKVEQMERELEHGKVQGFPGTLFMSGRPTFTTFRPFYDVVFAL